MTNPTRLLLATGFAGLMGLSLLTPVTYAQDMGAPNDTPPLTKADDNGQRGGPRGERGGFAGLICSTDGAGQLETKLDTLATQLKLTTEQQPLFDAYKTAALSAQTDFADTCAKIQPATATAPATPDALTVLKNRQARQTAELDAMNAVLPSFEALYTSLDDTQKATFMSLVGPHHGPGDHGPRGDRHDRAGRPDDRGGERGRGGRDRHDGRHGLVQPSAGIEPAVTAG